MAQGDGPAVDVHLVPAPIQPLLLHIHAVGQNLGRECFVKLD